jgi:hypothetical protein
MTAFSLYRTTAHCLAPLCARTAEGAQATELWQDKRDSLRLSRAVVLVLLVNLFAQAAHSSHSLSISTSRCIDSSNFTSSDCCHVW